MILYYRYFNVTIEFTFLLSSEEYIQNSFFNSCDLKIDSQININARCLITDNKSSISTKYDKIFFCINDYCDKILDDIPFNITILFGKHSVNFYNVVPDVFHNMKISFPVGCVNYNNCNITMREYVLRDFSDVYDLFHPLSQTSPESVNFMTESNTCEYNKFNNHLLSYSFDNTGYFGIFKENMLIGQVSIIHHTYNDNLIYELSYYIKDEFRQCHLTSSFVNMLLEYFYYFHNESELIYTVIHKSNIASIKFITKIGFSILETNNDYLIFLNKDKPV